VALIEAACTAGYSRACTNLAYSHYTGVTGANVSLRDIARLYQTGCDGGSGPGCTNLARMILAGEVPADQFPSVADLQTRGYDLGDPSGC
jgi:TPR repeat protein